MVSLEQAIAAPYATRQLADLGARVIKVERPDTGDFARGYDHRVNGLSSHFVWVNRNKESLALDAKDARGRELLHRLVATADVFVQNLAPGAAQRLGLGAAALRTDHPRLVVCDISGYGDGGPYTAMKAYDLMVQSEAGLVSVTGAPDAPAKVGISVSDIAAGMYAYSGVLAALLERGRTGHGSVVDVSMLESTVEWMGFPLYYSYDGAPPPPRAGAAHATIYPYGPFVAGDGQAVMMAIQNEREWARFCARFLGRPELAEHPDYASNALPRRPPRRAGRPHLRPVRRAHGGRRHGAAGGRPRGLRAGEHDGGGVGAPAAGGPRPLARGGHARGPGARARPARPRRPGAAHGPGARARRAHPAHPRRAGPLRRRGRRAGRGGRRPIAVAPVRPSGTPRRR